MSNPKTGMFRGDNEELIDHLIFASNEHKANKPLDSFGRELVPFFTPGEDLGPLPTQPAGRKHQSCGSPQAGRPVKAKSGKHGRKMSSSASARRSSSDDALAPATPEQQASPKAHQRATKSSSGIATGSATKSNSAAACPAFFSSPKPDAIPMPTLGFLNKAAMSGPHCMAPPAMQQMPRFVVPGTVA